MRVFVYPLCIYCCAGIMRKKGFETERSHSVSYNRICYSRDNMKERNGFDEQVPKWEKARLNTEK